MCGICGFVGRPRPQLLRAMAGDIAHRGPDAEGFFSDARCSLGHRRLSIIDLETGDQPLHEVDGQGRVLVYNGEVYNFRELRRELEAAGHTFRTRSDTEVVLAAYAEWGQAGIGRLEGIFAFAIWEPAHQRLVLARDALGIKPLRYRQVDDELYFASESRALFRTPGCSRRVSPRAIDALVNLRYDPLGDVFEDIQQVPPAHVLTFEAGQLTLRPFWSPPEHVEQRALSDDVERFRALFDGAVSRQLVADVPVGLFLSGGLDSSAILDAATRAGASRVHTFSIGFGAKRDEQGKAEQVARRYGAQHTSFVMASGDFLDRLEQTFAAFDEPVLDAIEVAQWELARRASEHVKVVLCGEGADEILAGYIHHRALGWVGRARRLTPLAPLGRLAARVVGRAPLPLLDRAFPYPGRLGASGRDRLADLSRALGRLDQAYPQTAFLFSSHETAQLYTADLQHALGGSPNRDWTRDSLARWSTEADVDAIVQHELRGWLPNNALSRLDRLTMAHGLEGRVPFLDRSLVEHALTSPHKAPPREAKTLLRRAMRGRLPTGTIRQPKQGFYLPLEETLGAPFDALLGELLSPDALRSRGLFQPDYVASLRRTQGHDLLSTKRLFALAALELWHRKVVDAPLEPLA